MAINKNNIGRRRESPQDFMLAYVQYLKENGYEDKLVQLTPKAFAILRGQKKGGGYGKIDTQENLTKGQE